MPVFTTKAFVIATAGLALAGGVANAQYAQAGEYYVPFQDYSRFCCSGQRGGSCYKKSDTRTKDATCYIQVAGDRIGEDYDTFRMAFIPSQARVPGPNGWPEQLSCIYSKASSIPGMSPESSRDLKLFWQVDAAGSIYAKEATSCPRPSDVNNIEPGKYFYVPFDALETDFNPLSYMGSGKFYPIAQQSGSGTQLQSRSNTVASQFLLAAGSPLRQNVKYRFKYSFGDKRYALGCQLQGDGCIVSGIEDEGYDLGRWTIVPTTGPSSGQAEIRDDPDYCLFWQNAENNQWYQIIKPPVSSGLIGVLAPSNNCVDNNFSIYPSVGPIANREEFDIRFGRYALNFQDKNVLLTLPSSGLEIGKMSAYNSNEDIASRENDNQGGSSSSHALIGGAAAGGAILGAGLMAVATVLRNKRTMSASDDSETTIVAGDLQGDNPTFKLREIKPAENLEDQL